MQYIQTPKNDQIVTKIVFFLLFDSLSRLMLIRCSTNTFFYFYKSSKNVYLYLCGKYSFISSTILYLSSKWSFFEHSLSSKYFLYRAFKFHRNLTSAQDASNFWTWCLFSCKPEVPQIKKRLRNTPLVIKRLTE